MSRDQIRPHPRHPVRVSFLPHAREVRVSQGDTVEEAAQCADVPFAAPCRGNGYCGACRVKFIEGAPPPGLWDRLHISPDELAQGLRLGCVAQLQEDAILSAPRQGPQVTIEDRRYGYRLAPPSQRAVVRATGSEASDELHRLLPGVALGDTPRELTLHLTGDQIRKVELGANRSDHLGVAAVLHGACMSGWLMDLRSGEELASGQAQLLGWAASGGRAESVAATSRRLVRSMCISARRRSEHVADVVLAGHRVLEADESTEPGIRYAGEGRDAVMDAACVAAVAAGQLYLESLLLLSITPIPWALCVSQGKASLMVARDPWSFPELFLPTGSPNAIERVEISSAVELDLNAAGPPAGLTLGGALDCVVELRRLGLLDRRGTLASRRDRAGGVPPEVSARLSEPGDKPGFLLAGTSRQPWVTLTHATVRAVQRLKATLSTLASGALGAAEVGAQGLDRVALVGPELASVNLRSALPLGLLPDVPASLVQSLPSALDIGVRLSLLSSEADAEMRELARSCVRLPEYELAGSWTDALYLDLRERGAGGPSRNLDLVRPLT